MDKILKIFALTNKVIYLLYFTYASAQLLKDCMLKPKPFSNGYLNDAQFTLFLIDAPMIFFIVLTNQNKFSKGTLFVINTLFLFINFGLIWMFFSQYFK